MKKKIGLLVFGATAVLTCGVLLADWVYNQNIVTNSPVAYSQNYALNLNAVPNQSGISRVSAQAIGSTATLSASTFTDGEVATGTVTLGSNSGLTLSTATDQITVAATASILAANASNNITIMSTSGIATATLTYYNGISSNSLVGNRDWFVTNTTSGTAASIAAALAGYQSLQVSRAGSVVYATATVAGASGNAYRFASSSPTVISTAAVSFSGGHDAPLQSAYIRFNGQTLYQGQTWLATDTSSGTATSIATLLNLMPGIQASAAGSVVYATATVGGSAANSYTLSSSTGQLAVASPTFTGGVNNAALTINGTTLTQGTDWTRTSTTTGTAKAVSDAINANATLGTIVTSAWTAGASSFTVTSKTVGLLSNYAWNASTTAFTFGHPTLVGGLNSAYSINTPTIFISEHGYTTGVPLLLTGSAPPSPLTAATTYYAIKVDANDVQLALTSTGAVAGTFITLTSSSTTGPHTTTLTPLAFTGTASFKWQVSNDCVNYQDFTTTSGGIAVSSVTFGTPYTAFVNNWDFGQVNYQCIRAAVVGPTTGAWTLQILVNGKNL